MLDHIDIHIEVPRVEYEKLSSARLGEPSANVRARIEAAREQQRQRFSGQHKNGSPNGLIHAEPKLTRMFTRLA